MVLEWCMIITRQTGLGLRRILGWSHGIVFIFPVTLMKFGMHGKHKAVEQNIPSRFLPRQCRNPWINPELKKSIRFGSKPRCQTILTNGCTKGLIIR